MRQGQGQPRDSVDGGSDLLGELRGWLGSGPIQSPSGAFYAWIDEETGQGSFEYPEITGYALTYLAGRPDPGDGELRRARAAADWLADRVARRELRARAGWDGEATYSFDLAMISAGLISFGGGRGSARHLEAGLELAAMLAREAARPRGLSPILGDEGRTSRSGWAAEGRPHLAKVVQCLLAAAEAGLPEGRDAASRLIEDTCELQESDGSFRTQPGSDGVMLHAHLYAAEGLWIWATSQGDSAADERSRLATSWAWEHQLASGGFPRSVGSPEGGAEVEQCDASAQALRMAATLQSPPPRRDDAVSRLDALSRPAPGGAALVYQPGPGPVHHNAWTTMFAAQALEWARSGPTGWRTLV
ncbi:MAG: hypothetical protein ACXWZM_06390 [Solirubrobacterales bacterium]